MAERRPQDIPEIMCTLTPKQILGSERVVIDMYHSGMRSVRINTAHLTGVEQLHELASRLKALLPDVGILIDTKGPEMRTTAIACDAAIDLAEGAEVQIAGCADDQPSTATLIHVNYPEIHTEVHAGDQLLIDDGHLSLRVEAVADGIITARVERGGMLGSRKGLAVHGVDIGLPAVSEHDRMYISYAAQTGCIDLIAHSFVRSASDVMAVRQAMGALTKPVIAKIENQQGIDHLADIIAVADGVLIARGDLTASLGAAAIPAAQAAIAAAVKSAGKPLYLATNILPSMMHDTTPSAADVSAIEVAKGQGVDVMLLTNETATGAYPQQCVSELHRILMQP